MAYNKKPRELETRQQEVRPMQWTPPELLPEPDKQPGYKYRWIRVSLLNNADPRNISRSMREGYEPVSIEEQPKFKLLIDRNSQFAGNIEIGGLLLCKAPIEMVEARAQYYEKMTRAQAEAVDNSLMRQSDARMPIFQERKSSTSFGKGT
jgi:hypothetical protein